jgi:hypothetical protein
MFTKQMPINPMRDIQLSDNVECLVILDDLLQGNDVGVFDRFKNLHFCS